MVGVADAQERFTFSLSGIKDRPELFLANTVAALGEDPLSCIISSSCVLKYWRRRRIPLPSLLGGKVGGRSQSAARSTSRSYRQSARIAEAVALRSPRKPARKFSGKQRALVVVYERCEFICFSPLSRPASIFNTRGQRVSNCFFSELF
jgi:hypothetical protein